MKQMMRVVVLSVSCVLGLVQTAHAQSSGGQDGWAVTVYPILAWVPIGIDIGVDIPPIDGSAGGSGDIIDSRFDGAFFGGVSASNNTWRIEGYGIWAGVGGDRPDRPALTVDLDHIYGDAKVGR